MPRYTIFTEFTSDEEISKRNKEDLKALEGKLTNLSQCLVKVGEANNSITFEYNKDIRKFSHIFNYFLKRIERKSALPIYIAPD